MDRSCVRVRLARKHKTHNKCSSQYNAWNGGNVNVNSSNGVNVNTNNKFNGNTCRCFFAYYDNIM